MTRTIVLALCVLTLAGCQLYWRKPGADMTTFSADHTACVQSGGTPVGNEGRLMMNLKAYRACLVYFRGLEDEGPVRVGDVPAQVPSRNLPGRSR